MKMNKAQLMKDVDAALTRHIEGLRKSVKEAQEMTRDAPGRIASRYDTSREEMGWLASGQAALLNEWERHYAAFKALGTTPKSFVQLGAFFIADSLIGAYTVKCLICRGGGGFECETAEGKVMLISPSSPLAQSAIGKYPHDSFTVNGGAEYVIREVA